MDAKGKRKSFVSPPDSKKKKKLLVYIHTDTYVDIYIFLKKHLCFYMCDLTSCLSLRVRLYITRLRARGLHLRKFSARRAAGGSEQRASGVTGCGLGGRQREGAAQSAAPLVTHSSMQTTSPQGRNQEAVAIKASLRNRR